MEFDDYRKDFSCKEDDYRYELGGLRIVIKQVKLDTKL